MRNRSVAAVPLLDKSQVALLSELFTLLFQHYRQSSSVNRNDFIRHLRTLAVIGFAPSVVTGSLHPYRHYFNAFLQANCGEFKNDSGSDTLWGSRMAEIIRLGLDGFRRLSYQNYYPFYLIDFLDAIERCLNSLPIKTSSRSNEAKQLLALLPAIRY